jgi:tRNA A-37 threonylcarbamoyl transferase component Bud32
MNTALNCRLPDDLQRFLLGQLSADEADQVQQHLAACPRCLDTVSSLKASDTLVEAMRAQAGAASPPEADVVALLIGKLSGRSRTSDTTTGEGTNPGQSSAAAGQHMAVLGPAQAADEIGRLGGYRVLRVLGAGGMGIVFEAEDPQLKRKVALKVMRPELAEVPANRHRFLREAQAAAAIEHDHIVTIHQVGEDRGVPFLAMPLLKGETLEDALRRAEGVSPPVTLPLADVLRITREIAAGLAAAHAAGLTHRDIKPANIWLEKSGRVKILDFGLARPEQDDAHLTQTGSIAGTPQYMAPEQASGQPVDSLSDLFSLGVVLYRLLTGRLPFCGPNAMAILRSLAVETPEPPHKIRPETPRALSDLAMRLLAKAPQDRPQSASGVVQELEKIEHAISPPLSPRGRGAGGEAASRHRTFIAAAVALLLAPLAAWYAPTIYRIATNQGLLIIQTDDPAVEVTVKQDGELVKIIDRKSGREVTLKAGTYQLELSGGKSGLKLETTQFTLTRGDREIVRVQREPAATPAPVPATAPSGSPKFPFVVLSKDGRAEQKFATLAEAVAAAASGDAIEVRGNGPMIREPIIVTGKALTIRAAPGRPPVLEFSPVSLGQGFEKYVRLQTDAPLRLEGLEIRRVGGTGEKVQRAEWAVVCRKAQVRMANCRFVITTQPGTTALWADRSALCEVRNCEFVLGQGCSSLEWTCPSTGRLIWGNSVTAGGIGPGIHIGQPAQDIYLYVTSSTFVGPALYVNLTLPPHAALGDGNQPAPPCRMEVTDNVFHSGYVLGFFQDIPLDPPETAQTAAEAEALLPRLVAWHGRRNLYPEHLNFLALGAAGETLKQSAPRRTLEDWRQFWGPTETDSLQRRILFQGGEVLTKAHTVPDQVTPGDVRLHADSAGKGAGEGGRDLGADVDLVGPGTAYERWKQTPAYQEWLKAADQKP